MFSENFIKKKKKSYLPVIYLANFSVLKFKYSEKAAKFCEIFTLLLTGTTQDKSKVKISKICVAFSEYMNFTKKVLVNFLSNFISNCLISVTMNCGGTSAENCTYFDSSTTVVSGACKANICKVNTNICQIRLDFR